MRNGLSKLLVSLCLAVMLVALLGVPALAESPCAHEYAKVERPTGNTYPATCVEAGGYYVEVVCDGCGAHLYEYKQPDPTNYPINKNAHKFVTNTLQGECAGGSAEQKVCTLCGYTETNTSNSGHNWVAKSYTASTCGETSYTYEECSKCGMTQNYKNTTTVSTHTYTKNPVVHVRAATCSVQGEDQQKCDCGEKTKVIPLAKIAHTYAAPVTTQGNCTTRTRTTETCTVCGSVHVISEGSVVHSYVERDVVGATCTEPGVRESRCSVCGALKWQVSTPKLGHSYGWQSDSTHHWRSCSRCSVVTESESHVGNNTTDYCTNRISCKICGYLMSTGTKHPGYTAVDSGNDSTHDMKCTSCSYISSHVSHTYTYVDGDCTKGKVCSACGHRASGNAQHSLSSIWTSAGASQHSRKCVNAGCNYAVKEDHEWGDWVVVKEATTTSVGTESRKCVKCPTTTVRAIPQLQPGTATKGTEPATATPEPTSAQQTTAGHVTATDAPEATAGSAVATATPKPATGNATATATPKPATGSAVATATPKPARGSATATATPKPATGSAVATAAPQATAAAETAAPNNDSISAAPFVSEPTAAPAQEQPGPAETDATVDATAKAEEQTVTTNTAGAAAMQLTQGTTCAAAGRACTEEEFLQGGLLIRVCTICGHVTAQALFDGMGDAQPVFTAVTDVTVTGAAQEGQLVLMAANLADAVSGDTEVFLALSAAWELDGQAQALEGTIQVSVPLAVPTAQFRLVRVDVEVDEENGRIEAWTDVDCTYEDGVLTFEMDRTAIYLLIPA